MGRRMISERQIEGYDDWNCVFWIEEALSWAAHDGKALGSCHTDWTYVKDTAMWYVEKRDASDPNSKSAQCGNGIFEEEYTDD